MVARVLRQAADPVSGRGPALDRRVDPGVPWAFHRRRPARPNPHGAHFPPQFKTPWPAPAHQTTLALNRLTRRQVAEWMRRDAGAALPESLVAQIYHRTSGVPLLVEEFTRMARESMVFESAGVASPRVPAASTRELPQTLQELVIAPLHRMSNNSEGGPLPRHP